MVEPHCPLHKDMKEDVHDNREEIRSLKKDVATRMKSSVGFWLIGILIGVLLTMGAVIKVDLDRLIIGQAKLETKVDLHMKLNPGE